MTCLWERIIPGWFDLALVLDCQNLETKECWRLKDDNLGWDSMGTWMFWCVFFPRLFDIAEKLRWNIRIVLKYGECQKHRAVYNTKNTQHVSRRLQGTRCLTVIIKNNMQEEKLNHTLTGLKQEAWWEVVQSIVEAHKHWASAVYMWACVYGSCSCMLLLIMCYFTATTWSHRKWKRSSF